MTNDQGRITNNQGQMTNNQAQHGLIELSSMTKTTDKIIEYGIIFLIIFTPLAFGSIHYWSIALMEFMALVMITIWTIARLIQKYSVKNSLSSNQNGIKKKYQIFESSIHPKLSLAHV